MNGQIYFTWAGGGVVVVVGGGGGVQTPGLLRVWENWGSQA